MKYDMYIKVLDKICEEAPHKYATYHPIKENTEKINQARAKASIHLFLKVMFGVLGFEEREHYITDGAFDGGIDAYYIDSESKTIYIIQAKFRTTVKNFENKEIELSELLNMDIDRILKGEEADEEGNKYNGKIKQLQRDINKIDNIARYNYKIYILANLPNVTGSKLRKLTDGYSAEIFNYERCYKELLFPVISGTYFTASDISIPVDLSNKYSGTKISYTVTTKISDCEITVLFIPTMELAKVMLKYKNSILKYNPRSYLEFEGKFVHEAIKGTICNSNTNEFALFNNGITILSDETYINERIGQKNKAQLTIKNPQIINGGQTAFTLSRLYKDASEQGRTEIFDGKEVLVKVITLLAANNDEDKMRLIYEISNATNKQTPVINADKYANESLHVKIQNKIFDKYGLLFERKRGEFSDGIINGYIKKEEIIERNNFFRIFYVANGNIVKGSQKRLFQSNQFNDILLTTDEQFDRFYGGYLVFKELVKGLRTHQKIENDIYGKVLAYVLMNKELVIDQELVQNNLIKLESKWLDYLDYISKTYKLQYIDKKTGLSVNRFNFYTFAKSKNFQKSIVEFFSDIGNRPVVQCEQ